MQYLPLGEAFIDQRIDWETRYNFSAKEKGKITGYSYFGFRYLDSKVSVWLSVDPLADHFPSWTPYHYFHANPLNMVDPLGMSMDWFQNEITGAVCYNSTMKKSAKGTGAMKSEGWSHLGESGMFTHIGVLFWVELMI